MDKGLTARLHAETTDEAFEAKVGALPLGAYTHNTARDPEAKKTYKEACRALKKGDHYILVMID